MPLLNRLLMALVMVACGGAAVLLSDSPASASVVATFSSQQTGTSGQTAQFTVAGPWTIAWTYDCSNAYGGSGVFGISYQGNLNIGPNESGTSGSGTDYYTDAGTFSLLVNSECNWTATISTNSAGPATSPVTFTSQQIGDSGESPQFTVNGPWSMAWTYNCANAYGGSGVFGISYQGTFDIGPNENGTSGSGTDYYTDSGTFSLEINSECHWSATITGSPAPTPTPTPTPLSHGYWLVGSDGGIFSFGSAQFYGSTGALTLQRPVVGITPTANDGGYWLVASDGGIFSFGNAGFYGSIPGIGLAPAGSANPKRLNAPIVGMVPSADGGGYFMVASDGGVFAFGDAKFEGSCPGIGGCSGAAVAVMPDASGNGYWLVTATGNVYTFGDAVNYGAPGDIGNPTTAAVRTPDGLGYWILYANGSVFFYGDAAVAGSPLLDGVTSLTPDTAIFATSDGKGYWVAAADGTVYNYGDAPNDGGMAGQHLNGSIIAATGW
jgi:hypothetical protein